MEHGDYLAFIRGPLHWSEDVKNYPVEGTSLTFADWIEEQVRNPWQTQPKTILVPWLACDDDGNDFVALHDEPVEWHFSY